RGGRAPSLGRGPQTRAGPKTPQSTIEVSDDVIEADAAQAEGCFALATGIGDDQNRPVAAQYASRPGRVLACQSNVDASGEIRRRELGRVPSVQQLGPDLLQGQGVIE